MANILFIKTTKCYSSDKALSPPLGILYLIAYLRRARPDDRLRMVDLRTEHDGPIALESVCRGFAPDIIAFSAMTIEADSLHAMAAWCKQRFPQAVIIVGGPHASSFGAHILSDAHINYILAGEGERPLLKFIAALEVGQRAPAVSGLSFKSANGEIVAHPPNEDLADIDNLPIPAWDMIDFERYTDARMAPISFGKYAALFTSRGCPYRCTYCHNIFPKRYRAMSAKRVVDEIEYLKKTYGVNEFEIYDDTFNLQYERATAICDEIIRRGLNIRLLFPNGVRGDLLDEALIRKLRQAGTIFLAVAVRAFRVSPRNRT